MAGTYRNLNGYRHWLSLQSAVFTAWWVLWLAASQQADVQISPSPGADKIWLDYTLSPALLPACNVLTKAFSPVHTIWSSQLGRSKKRPSHSRCLKNEKPLSVFIPPPTTHTQRHTHTLWHSWKRPVSWNVISRVPWCRRQSTQRERAGTLVAELRCP